MRITLDGDAQTKEPQICVGEARRDDRGVHVRHRTIQIQVQVGQTLQCRQPRQDRMNVVACDAGRQ